jgi:hypothetical protein
MNTFQDDGGLGIPYRERIWIVQLQSSQALLLFAEPPVDLIWIAKAYCWLSLWDFFSNLQSINLSISRPSPWMDELGSWVSRIRHRRAENTEWFFIWQGNNRHLTFLLRLHPTSGHLIAIPGESWHPLFRDYDYINSKTAISLTLFCMAVYRFYDVGNMCPFVGIWAMITAVVSVANSMTASIDWQSVDVRCLALSGVENS